MRFVIKPAKRGLLKRNQKMLSLVADNGKSVMSSEAYNNEGDILAILQKIRDEAATAPLTYE